MFCSCFYGLFLFIKVKKDVEGYDFYKHFGGRIKLMENAVPSKQLGEYKEFEKVEVMSPTEEPCEEVIKYFHSMRANINLQLSTVCRSFINL